MRDAHEVRRWHRTRARRDLLAAVDRASESEGVYVSEELVERAWHLQHVGSLPADDAAAIAVARSLGGMPFLGVDSDEILVRLGIRTSAVIAAARRGDRLYSAYAPLRDLAHSRAAGSLFPADAFATLLEQGLPYDLAFGAARTSTTYEQACTLLATQGLDGHEFGAALAFAAVEQGVAFDDVLWLAEHGVLVAEHRAWPLDDPDPAQRRLQYALIILADLERDEAVSEASLAAGSEDLAVTFLLDGHMSPAEAVRLAPRVDTDAPTSPAARPLYPPTAAHGPRRIPVPRTPAQGRGVDD